ncbi:transposable element Tc3 transposase [Trichonephila clavipes]|nr:transposable element Tc3 transposase [Trichonephila clavipes]
MIGRRIAARQPSSTCLPELRRVLLDEWCNIPQDQIDNLILSMPRRFAFPQRSSRPRLIEDKALNDSDIINSLIYYEEGQEEPDI